MRPNRLREMFARRETAVGAWLSCDSGYLAEVLSHAGYDAVTVDLQHGMFGFGRAVALLQAVSAGPAVPMVRCAGHDPGQIGKLLDAGAYGVICPGVDSAEQCRDFVAACRYPPAGVRSFGPSRGLLYGGPDYVANADFTVLTWAMVESGRGVADLDAILAVPGLDGVYVGPNDLALDLGLQAGGDVVPDQVQAVLQTVLAAAHARGRLAGAFCSSPEQAYLLAASGYDLVTPGTDVALVREAAANRLAVAKGQRSGGPQPPGGSRSADAEGPR